MIDEFEMYVTKIRIKLFSTQTDANDTIIIIIETKFGKLLTTVS